MLYLDELLDFLMTKKIITSIQPYNENIHIKKFSSLSNPSRDSLCWTKKKIDIADVPDCAVLICLDEQPENPEKSTYMIHVSEPRKVFAAILNHFYPVKYASGIAETAVLDPSVRLGERVYIGPGCVIGANCVIGDNTILDANVTLYDNVKIGRRCHISSCSVIGADGYGYILNEKMQYEKIRHIGGVTIGDDVDIGANSCVDRGVLDDTIVGDNTKIDNLVQIAHNVKVGSNCSIIAGAVLAGSSVIGDNCWISPGSIVSNGVVLSNEVQLGMNSVVYRSVKESNVTLYGDPAVPVMKYKIK